jgi:outer membrane biosynthesis protein TonB
MTPTSLLQIAMVWQGRILAYRLIRPGQKVTVGPSPRATFLTPPGRGDDQIFVLLAPAKPRGRYRLRLTPALDGELTVRGETKQVVDVLTTGTPSARDAAIREIDLDPGDKARLRFTGIDSLRLEIRYVEPPARIARPRLSRTEPFLVRIASVTSLLLTLLVGGAILFAPEEAPKSLALTVERVATMLPPEPPPPPEKGAKKKAEEKTKEESGQMKKAKGDQGRLGKKDASPKETVIPKGEKDILRDKVSKVGLLGLIGKERPQGSGLAKLFAENTLEVEQAVAGMAGAHLVAGRGAGGLSTTGAGLGGGGTGQGHLYGAGDMDTGGRASRGHGRGPTLASRKEHEVKLDIAAGNVDDGGGLTKEQVARVVRAHSNAIKFCYEKELQRKPTLSGKIEVYWVILPDGSVDKSKIASTSMEDAAVEGCVARQVKQWAFPKSDGRTVVQSYPFLFKGGV